MIFEYIKGIVYITLFFLLIRKMNKYFKNVKADKRHVSLNLNEKKLMSTKIKNTSAPLMQGSEAIFLKTR